MRPGSHHRTVLEVVVHLWPLTIFVPAVLTLIVVLVVVTRFADRRDEAHAAERAGRTAPAAGAATPWPRSATDGPRRWGRRTRCDCSWHTTGVAVGIVSPPLAREPVRSGRDAT